MGLGLAPMLGPIELSQQNQAKSFIDVVVCRGSDALYGWLFESLQAIGLKLGVVALCALPVAAEWLALSTALGRGQERRAGALGSFVNQRDAQGKE